jgi:hypothetical protein
MRALLIPALLLAAGCATKGREKAEAAPRVAPGDWRAIISGEDRDRLARWRGAWMGALDKAVAAGKGAQINALGALLKPDIALDKPALPPGDYNCRVIKMGSQSIGLPDFVTYPAFTCRITQEGALSRFAKVDGSQRPVGTIYADEGRRMIFLGSMMLGDETRPLRYGRDSERDMVGIVERVAPTRWRIAFPYPRWESVIDILELVPKGS